MEGGASRSGDSCIMGFNNDITMSLKKSDVEAYKKAFLPLPLSTNNSYVQRASALMPEDGNGNLMEINNNCMKAKIVAHPLFPRLLAAYINCQKVGAPPEVVARVEEDYANSEAAMGGRFGAGCIGQDPGLDQFTAAYCEMLTKYEQEVSKPFKEAMLFFSRTECQLKDLAVSLSDSGGDIRRNGSSEEEVDANDNSVDPQVDDRELKVQLLHKYSGYLGSLKQEFLKKKKNGKLPKEARQRLLDWWNRHYKWPYPSESQKVALAESTCLDLKQINNWFINQRKRRWKPPEEDMQFVVMDATHPHCCIDNVMCSPFSMDCTPMLL